MQEKENRKNQQPENDRFFLKEVHKKASHEACLETSDD